MLCSEEHTITQILTGLGLEAQWRNVEHFAEYGAWDRETVERQLMRLVEQEHPARWGAYVYGHIRTFRYKCLRCCWSVSGPQQIMVAFVFEVPGYDKLWATIASADDLSAGQVLSANSGRFRQEDGFRDHK